MSKVPFMKISNSLAYKLHITANENLYLRAKYLKYGDHQGLSGEGVGSDSTGQPG